MPAGRWALSIILKRVYPENFGAFSVCHGVKMVENSCSRGKSSINSGFLLKRMNTGGFVIFGLLANTTD